MSGAVGATASPESQPEFDATNPTPSGLGGLVKLCLSADVGRVPVWACLGRGPVLDQRVPTFRRGAR